MRKTSLALIAGAAILATASAYGQSVTPTRSRPRFGDAFSWWHRNCACFSVLTACLVPTLASPRLASTAARVEAGEKVSQS
jgi:hypothetical protein